VVHFFMAAIMDAKASYDRGNISEAEEKLVACLKEIDSTDPITGPLYLANRRDPHRFPAWELLAEICFQQNRFSECLQLKMNVLNNLYCEYPDKLDWTDPISMSDTLRQWTREKYHRESEQKGPRWTERFYNFESGLEYRLRGIAELQSKCGNAEVAALWEKASTRRLQQEEPKPETPDEAWERWIRS